MSRCPAGAAEGLGLASGVCCVELQVAIFEAPAGCVMMTCSRFKPTQCCRDGLVLKRLQSLLRSFSIGSNQESSPPPASFFSFFRLALVLLRTGLEGKEGRGGECGLLRKLGLLYSEAQVVCNRPCKGPVTTLEEG